jgi:hypothetical protein
VVHRGAEPAPQAVSRQLRLLHRPEQRLAALLLGETMTIIWGASWGAVSIAAVLLAQSRLRKFAAGIVSLAVVAITVWATVNVAQSDQFFASWLVAGLLVVAVQALWTRAHRTRSTPQSARDTTP